MAAPPSQEQADAVHGAAGTVQEQPGHGPAEGHEGGPIDVSGSLFLWTIVTFAIVATVLTKLVWKPMLEALDKRENYLRQSLEDADRIEQEMAAIEETRKQKLAEADAKGREMLERARRAGVEAERVIKDKARDEAAILMENAEREIGAARDKARADLRRDSVDTAIALAGRLLRENLDDEKNRRLTDRLIEQL